MLVVGFSRITRLVFYSLKNTVTERQRGKGQGSILFFDFVLGIWDALCGTVGMLHIYVIIQEQVLLCETLVAVKEGKCLQQYFQT